MLIGTRIQIHNNTKREITVVTNKVELEYNEYEQSETEMHEDGI